MFWCDGVKMDVGFNDFSLKSENRFVAGCEFQRTGLKASMGKLLQKFINNS